MKKSIFYFAFAALAALTFTACGSSSDDDNSGGNGGNSNVTLKAPNFTEQVAKYKLTTPMKVSAATEMEETDTKLSSVELTESGYILVELIDPNGKPIFVQEKAAVSGETYSMSGSKISGTITKKAAATRAGDVQLQLNITVTLPLPFGTLTFNSGSEALAATLMAIPGVADYVVGYFCRTWSIVGATLDLKSTDVTAYKEFSSRGGLFYMEDVLAEAQKRGVSFTSDEVADLQKKLKNVTITRSGDFILNYDSGQDDVATWSWSNSQKTGITIKMKDGDMGNKFINDNTKMGVAFNGNRCNLTMKINFDDSASKKWDAQLMLVLQSE